MAVYPAEIKSFDRRQDGRDIVVANDVNVVYDEVEEIQKQLGVGGVETSLWTSTTPFSTTISAWRLNGGLKARLDNIERGVLKGINESVSISGGSIITSAGFGLAIKAANSGQTGYVLEVRNSVNSITFGVDGAGKMTATGIDGGTA
jgi:hypothetical protein